MNTEIKVVLGYLIIVITAFVAATKLIGSMSHFMNFAHISEADVCLVLLLSGAILYQDLKRKAEVKKIRDTMNKLEIEIIKKCTNLIDTKIDKLTLIIANNDEKLERTNKDVTEIKGIMLTMNQNIIKLVGRGS